MLQLFLTLALLLLSPYATGAEKKPEATLYRVPFCGCCDGHAEHLRANGYSVTVVETKNMSVIKKKYGVPQEFEGCHTIEVGGYVVEGHVTATVIDKLLKDRPAIRGISLPGMPDGSPGMSGTKKGPFVFYELSKESGKVFATE
ncbi:MAG: DUF411 domain-containing protein [Xanthobacteraceae bacterium]